LFPILADFVVNDQALQQAVSSFAGGQEITLTGFGFDENTEVYIHGQSLDLIEAKFDEIKFLTPRYMTFEADTDFHNQEKSSVHDHITHKAISDKGDAMIAG
jgi:hypothetical protein